MLSKNHCKLINALKLKKNRTEKQLFVVEGVKSVKEVLKSDVIIEKLFQTPAVSEKIEGDFEKFEITEEELKKISQLKQPAGILAVCKMPTYELEIKESELYLALDELNDPGNLGTIIRLADWFGITQIIASENPVYVYNPKVIQASMGSFTRVKVIYTDLEKFLQHYKQPIIGTFLEGENLYQTSLPKQGIIIMGNEANGISDAIKQLVTQKITIPHFGNRPTESLNVAMATSIILSEFRRNQI